MSSPQLSVPRVQYGSTLLRWLKWGLIAAVSLELGYLAVFNIWIPARLVAFAKRYDLDLQLTGFRTLYPGDLRAESARLSGPNQSFDITTKAARARVKLWALLGGSFDIAWLRIASVSARVKRPGALLFACSPSGTAGKRDKPQEAGLGELPNMQQIRVDRATISLVSAELGALTLSGNVEVRATRARLAEVGIEMEAFAHLVNVHATRGAAQNAPLAALDGDVAWKLSPRTGAGHVEDGTRFSVRSSMRWKTANIGALLGAGPDIDARDAHLAVELRMADGATRPGSYVELQSAELRSPALHVGPGGALFHQARLRLDLAAQKPSHDHLTGSFSLRSADVAFNFHGQPEHFSLAGDATIADLNTSSSSLRLSAGQFHAERAESQDPKAGAQQALHLALTLDRAYWSSQSGLGLTGLLIAHGSDASALLDLGPPDPGARWMLSELVSAPFMLRLGVRLTPERIALEDIVLNTPRDNAQGALVLSDAGPRGAFLFERGKLNIGIEVEADATKLNLSADKDWLTRTVAALRSARAPDTNGL